MEGIIYKTNVCPTGDFMFKCLYQAEDGYQDQRTGSSLDLFVCPTRYFIIKCISQAENGYLVLLQMIVSCVTITRYYV